jgi:exopolysaccharide biosynthesis protein
LRYKTDSLPASQVYTLTIPAHSPYRVSVALSETVSSLKEFAQAPSSPRGKAIAVINGGYFDPSNRQTTSYVVQNGKIIGDPRQNKRLIANVKLKPYLSAILNRSEFRIYHCDQATKYAITAHNAPIPAHCQLRDAIAAGPQLLPTLTAESEAFVSKKSGQITRDAIGVYQANARSAIALTAQGDLIWAIAAQTAPGRGLSLPEMAKFLKSLGAVQALNLDGGSSSSLYYQGTTHFGKLDEQGQKVQRPVKSALIARSP